MAPWRRCAVALLCFCAIAPLCHIAILPLCPCTLNTVIATAHCHCTLPLRIASASPIVSLVIMVGRVVAHIYVECGATLSDSSPLFIGKSNAGSGRLPNRQHSRIAQWRRNAEYEDPPLLSSLSASFSSVLHGLFLFHTCTAPWHWLYHHCAKARSCF